MFAKRICKAEDDPLQHNINIISQTCIIICSTVNENDMISFTSGCVIWTIQA